ncbi:MAG: DUF4442 domain-containing protein [Crocinitomicaceae bacterium]|nr:DUF4442 domain-containing protein [Crocinitomicaceae bacterium]
MSQSKELSIRKMRWKLFLLGAFKIPMIGFIRPRLVDLNDVEASIKIKLRRRSKNHLKSMYFGALSVGADVSAGLHAFYFAEKMGKKVSFAFKGMKVDFLMRAETDIMFTSQQGMLVEQAMLDSLKQGERVNRPIQVIATNTHGDIVARFELIISVRVK